MDPFQGYGRLRAMAAVLAGGAVLATAAPALAASPDLPRGLDRGLDSRCAAAVAGGSPSAFCDRGARGSGRVAIRARGYRSSARRHGTSRVTHLRGTRPLKPGLRVEARGGRAGRHAQLALVYAVGDSRVYVRFGSFPTGRRLRANVTSRLMRNGGLVVRLRVAGRNVRPRIQRVVPPAAAKDDPAHATATGWSAGTPVPPATPRTGCGRSLPGYAGRDDDFTALWSTCGPGWTGSDGAYSVALPDGRSAWLFGDSFTGSVNDDGSRPQGSPFLNNTMVVQSGSSLTTLTGRTAEHPQSLVTPADPANWYWPADGTVEGDRLRVLMLRMRRTGTGGPWDFQYAGTDVATFTLPGLALESVTPKVDGGAVSWGSAVMEDDGYTYVYGVEADPPWHKYLHVARVPRGGLLGRWEYWTGSAWSTAPASSARTLDGVSDQLSVWKDGATYRILSQGNLFSRDLISYTSSSPVGPWSAGHVAYTIPDPGGSLFTYNAVVHPEFANASGLLVSYSVNSNDGADLYRDVTSYRPRFVRLPVSALDG